jgi:DNA polymerase III alpha subunit
MINYTPLHMHSHFSNVVSPDVVVNENMLAKRASELGMKKLALTDHGSTLGKLAFQKACDKHKIMPIFGMEGYFVRDVNKEVVKMMKVRGKEKETTGKDDNNGHIIFLAKNKDGLGQINLLMSDSYEFGFYRKPRVDIAMIRKYLNPKDVVVSTACIGGLIKKEGREIIHEFQDFIDEKNFYLEVQSHNNDLQKEYNTLIKQISRDTGIPIIVTTDTHAVDVKTAKLRKAFLHSKNIIYEEEEGAWSIDFPSYEELLLRMKEQGVFTEQEIMQMLQLTNTIADEIERIDLLQHEYKIPVLKKYQHLNIEERYNIFEKLIYSLFDQYKASKNMSPQEQEKYLEGIQYEIGEIYKCKMHDYFLLNYYIVKTAIENYGGVLTKTSRGSASCFFVNFLLGFTAMDRFVFDKLPLFPQRFLTAERVLESMTPPDCKVA